MYVSPSSYSIHPKTYAMSIVLFLFYAAFRALATWIGDTLPLRISCVVERMVDQFSKVVYGIPLRSQKVTKSVAVSACLE